MVEETTDQINKTTERPEPEQEMETQTKTENGTKEPTTEEARGTEPEENGTTQALHKRIVELEREKEEYLQSYLRLRADFENYKRRTRQEMLQAAMGGKEELLAKMLPVLDNLDLALGNTGDLEQWRTGIEMIFRQFFEVLVQEGLKPIPAVGEEFDPNLHEAMLREPSAEPENTILEELKKGYLFGEKTLRPSLVKVAAFDPDLATAKEKE